MKYRFLAVFALCLVLPFAIILGACKQNEEPKTDDEVKLVSVRVEINPNSWCTEYFVNNEIVLNEYSSSLSRFSKNDFVVTAEYSDGTAKVVDNYVYTMDSTPRAEVTKNNKQYEVYHINFSYQNSATHSINVYVLKYDPSSATTIPALSGLTTKTVDEEVQYWITATEDWEYSGNAKNAFSNVFVENTSLREMIEKGQILTSGDGGEQVNAGEYRASIWPGEGYGWSADFVEQPTISIFIYWSIKKHQLSTPTLSNATLTYREIWSDESSMIVPVPQRPQIQFAEGEEKYFADMLSESTCGEYESTLNIKHEYQSNVYLLDNDDETTFVTLNWSIVPATVSSYLSLINFDNISVNVVYQGAEFTPDQIANVLNLESVDPYWANKITITMADAVSENINNTNISIDGKCHGEFNIRGIGNFAANSGNNEAIVVSKEFSIEPYEVTQSVGFSGVESSYEYETKLVTPWDDPRPQPQDVNFSPLLKVTFGETRLEIPQKFYKITYGNGNETEYDLSTVGEKSATITLKTEPVDGEYCNYTGSYAFTFSISKKTIEVNAERYACYWSGSQLTYTGENQASSVVFHPNTSYDDFINIAYSYTYHGDTPTDKLEDVTRYCATATLSLKEEYSTNYALRCIGGIGNGYSYNTEVVISPVLVGQIGNSESQTQKGSEIKIFIGNGQSQQQGNETIIVYTSNLTELEYTGNVVPISTSIKAKVNGDDYILGAGTDYILKYYKYKADSEEEWIECKAGDVKDVGKYRVEINYTLTKEVNNKVYYYNNFACYNVENNIYDTKDYWGFDVIQAQVPNGLKITLPTVNSYIWSTVATLNEDGHAELNDESVDVSFSIKSGEFDNGDTHYVDENNQVVIIASFANYRSVEYTQTAQAITPFTSFSLNGTSIGVNDLEKIESLVVGDEIEFTFDSEKFSVTNYLKDSNAQYIENAEINYANGTGSYVVGYATDNDTRYNERGFMLCVRDLTLLVEDIPQIVTSRDFAIDFKAPFSVLEVREKNDDSIVINYLEQNALEEPTWSVGDTQKLYIELAEGYALNYDKVSPSGEATQVATKVDNLELPNDGSFASIVLRVYRGSENESETLILTLHYNFDTTSVMTMEINPKVEFVLDNENRVTKINALNDDGQYLINTGYLYTGNGIYETIYAFLNTAKEQGYIVTGEENFKVSTSNISLNDVIQNSINQATNMLNLTELNTQVDNITLANLQAQIAEVIGGSVADLAGKSEVELLDMLSSAREEAAWIQSQDLKDFYYIAKAQALIIAKFDAIYTQTLVLAENSNDENIASFNENFGSNLENLKTSFATLKTTYTDLFLKPSSPYILAKKTWANAKQQVLSSARDNGVVSQSLQTTLSNCEAALNQAIVTKDSTVQTLINSLNTLAGSLDDILDGVAMGLKLSGVSLDFDKNTAVQNFITTFNTEFDSYNFNIWYGQRLEEEGNTTYTYISTNDGTLFSGDDDVGQPIINYTIIHFNEVENSLGVTTNIAYTYYGYWLDGEDQILSDDDTANDFAQWGESDGKIMLFSNPTQVFILDGTTLTLEQFVQPIIVQGSIVYLTTMGEGDDVGTMVLTEEEFTYVDESNIEQTGTNRHLYVLVGEYQVSDIVVGTTEAFFRGYWGYGGQDTIYAGIEGSDDIVYFKIGDNNQLTMQMVTENILYTFTYLDGETPITIAICENNKYFVCYGMTSQSVAMGCPAMLEGDWESDGDNKIKALVYGAWMGFEIAGEEGNKTLTPYFPGTPLYGLVYTPDEGQSDEEEQSESSKITFLLYDTGSVYGFVGDLSENSWIPDSFPYFMGIYAESTNDYSMFEITIPMADEVFSLPKAYFTSFTASE